MLTLHGWVDPDGRELEVKVSGSGAAALEGQDLFLYRQVGDGAVECWPVHVESASEQLRREARARLAEKRAANARRAAAAELDALVPEALRPIIDLHYPDQSGGCLGCDVDDDSYLDRPVWPCRTIDLIRETWSA